MARNVNLFIDGYRATGKNVSVPQYAVNITINWTTNAGVEKTRSETVLFPNILNNVSNAWLKEHLQQLMLDALREIAGIDIE